MILPSKSLAALLQDAASRDRTTARRMVLFKILMAERYLTREQLIHRVEGVIHSDCFGKTAWKDTFHRDIQAVKNAFSAAGHQLAYSRSKTTPGYYLQSQPSIHDDLLFVLTGCVSEVDLVQLAIIKKLSYNQRFLQGCSIVNLAVQVVANRIQQKQISLSMAESQRLALKKRDDLIEHTNLKV